MAKRSPKGDGVIVGCAANHEWMLPWWWLNFRLHNNYPVTFFNFGDMSQNAKEWCRKRGKLKTLSKQNFIVKKEEIHETLHPIWQSTGETLDVWEARMHFFKKPFACLESPYERTIWIDLDAQVRQPIDLIFEFCENPYGMAIAEEPLVVREQHEKSLILQKGEMEYNTGVIVFKQQAQVIQNWAEACIKNNAFVRGDQEALSRLYHEKKERLPALLPIFNWRAHLPIPSHQTKSIVVIHWVGACKEYIRNQINVLSQCVMDLSLQ